MPDRSRCAAVVLAGLVVASCAPAPEADWRVDASKSVPWTPRAGLASCPVDDTLSPRLSVWHMQEVMDKVESAMPRQARVSSSGGPPMPERLWIREVLRHDPCAASGSVASGAVWRWLVLVGRGDRMSDSLELPWRDGVAVGPEERRNARSRGLDPGSEDEWSIEGLDGSCLEEWAQARYDQVLERAEGSDSALLEAISPRSAMLRRSRAGAEVLVDLRQGRLSRPSRTGACP